ncbi:TniQ family protein [Streptomyces sp. NPDC092369]|uniref:TniQ family protein n=1 Tax=Streptomyces sp. NPDC092369 TaxID=3366015 RepID=UPI00381F14E7
MTPRRRRSRRATTPCSTTTAQQRPAQRAEPVQRRVLARSLEPLPDESLPGFLLRLAYRLHRSPARVAQLCGIETNGQRRLAADYLLELPPDRAVEFARVTGLSLPEVQGLGLRRYTETFPLLLTMRGSTSRQSASRQGMFGSASQFYESNWAVNLSSRFCSQCLAGDGSASQEAYGGPWVLRWHLPVVFACTVHQQLLHSRCASCRSGLAHSYQGRATLITQPGSTHILHPLQCRNLVAEQDAGNTRPRPCSARLDRAEARNPATLTADDHERLMELQRRLDARLSFCPAKIEEKQSSRDPSFQKLVHIAQLIKLSWPAGGSLVPSDSLASLIDNHAGSLHAELRKPHARSSSRFSLLWAAPDDSGQCGALLLTAEAALSAADSPAQLRALIRPMARFALEHAPASACRSFFSRPGFSPALARAMVRRSHGFYAAGPWEYANLRVASRDCHFTAEEVPSHLPQSWYDAYFTDFADHVPGVNLYTVRHLRRAASLKLVEMARGGSWVECAQALDIPQSRARSALSKLRQQFGESDLWTRFQECTEQLARHLDGSPRRINYASRRRTLADWQMPRSDWSALIEGLPQARRLTARYGTTLGTVLAWTDATQSDYLLCPLLQNLRSAGADPSYLIDELSLSFTSVNQRGSRLELLRRIRDYATSIGTGCPEAPERSSISNTCAAENMRAPHTHTNT